MTRFSQGMSAVFALAAMLTLDSPLAFAQDGVRLVRLARVEPWPAVSGLIGYRDRLWFANSVKFRDHNSADIYSYDPKTGAVRYERHLYADFNRRSQPPPDAVGDDVIGRDRVARAVVAAQFAGKAVVLDAELERPIVFKRQRRGDEARPEVSAECRVDQAAVLAELTEAGVKHRRDRLDQVRYEFRDRN